MPDKISWKDIQYKRELEFYGKIETAAKNLREKYREFQEKTQIQEKDFFQHLSHALKIDQMPEISDLVTEIRNKLDIRNKINVFLYQFSLPNALCTPRFGTIDDEDDDELVILVSQHFINDLEHTEQLCILGHEIGHMLYGHVNIPAEAIMESEFNLNDARDIKGNIMKWRTCAEISCDAVGLIACDGDVNAFKKAMIKYTTGISNKAFETYGKNDKFYEMLISQYHDISESLFDTITSTHPLTLLRLKIADSICNLPIIQNFGEEVNKGKAEDYIKQYNSIIDDAVKRVYPEIISADLTGIGQVVFDMGIAVALADGSLDTDEIFAIAKITGNQGDIEDLNERINSKLSQSSYEEFIDETIEKSVKAISESENQKNGVMKILRQLIIVAASDGKIEACELNTIYAFVSNFNINKKDIVLIVNQMGIG